MPDRRKLAIIVASLSVFALFCSCSDDVNDRSDINVWRVDCDRGTMSLQVTGQQIDLASVNIAFTEADCTPASGTSCTLDYHTSPHVIATLGADGSFALDGSGISISGNLDRSTETGAGTLSVGHATGACECSISGPWTAVLSCTDMGTECIGASDCPVGESCQCGECAPTG
jgi:hypothetical protein